jgi:signal transduction histidine kinase
MKLWPRSMAGQLAGLLLLGLLAAHGLAILALQYNAQVLNPVARDRVLERLAITWRMLQLAERDEVQEVLDTLSTPSGRFWIDDAPPQMHAQPSDEEVRMLQALADKLPQVAPTDIRVVLELPRGGVIPAFRPDLGWSLLKLESAVRLPDGRWLHARQLPLAGYQWWRLLRFSLPTSTLPVLAIVLCAVWTMLRPLKALARAAERISRGEQITPLPLTGPRETREVSAAFNHMQERLARFLTHRTQMLAAISHDLRTPLTALRLRAELVDDAEQRAAMVRSLDEMRAMVEQTLQFTREDALLEPTCAVELRALLDEVVQEQRLLGHAVQLAPGPTMPYRARPVGLKRALTNLVDNAVRHGGQALVALEPAANGLSITVDDAGPGLPEHLLEQVFEPFFQCDAARKHAPGSGVGLGLSIARSCVRAHGGEVRLANRAQRGLRATVVLPASEP